MNIRLSAKASHRSNTFYVQSVTHSDVEYIVHNRRNAVSHRKTWTCNCPDFTERQVIKNGTCKHIESVRLHQRIGLPPFSTAFDGPAVALTAPVVPTPSTARAALEGVVAVLNGGGRESSLLWDILTALRGPDDGSDTLKDVTTAPLRGLIGMKSHPNAIVLNNVPLGYEEVKAEFEANPKMSYSRDHAYDAASDPICRKFEKLPIQNHFLFHYMKALQSAIELELMPRPRS